MKKLISLVFLMFAPLFLLLVFGHLATASAHSKDPVNSRSVKSDLLTATPDSFILYDTNAYTIYLPLIMGPPPLNPKKGLAIYQAPTCPDLENLKSSWYFNWGVSPDPSCAPTDSDKFVPRISNANSMSLLSQAIINAQASGWLIGFTEPNLPWQGNLTPAQGAVLWKQIEDAAIPAGIKLVSPAPNQWAPGENGLPYGHQWLWAMVDEYRARYGPNPHFDAIGWNIYKNTLGEFQAYLTARHNEALARGYDLSLIHI